MIVKIDNRETSRICEAVKEYMPRYKIIVEELAMGDFIFQENKKEVIFEYKAGYDLVISISNGRLFKQAIKQCKNFEHHNVIVEWDEQNQNKAFKFLKNKLTIADVYESLAMLSTFTNVIISPNKHTSFKLMEKYAKIYLEDKVFENVGENKTDNVAFNFLMLINGINKVKANAICKNLQLKTIDDLFNIDTKRLTRVPNIGPVTAAKIMSSIMTQN